MDHIEKNIEVNVPIATAYNQWTQFEDFPKFMEGVKSVKQLDAKRLHWVATLGGKDVEWDAEITQQTPDKRIAWRSLAGAENAGSVTFASVDAVRTRVTLRIEYDPQGLTEKVGNALGVVSARVEGDLKRFKEFIESRGRETGAWRGQIQGGQVRGGTAGGGREAGAGGSGRELGTTM